MAQNNANEIRRIACTQFFHDPRPVHFYRSRTDSKSAAGFLVGSSVGDFLQDFQLTAVSRSAPWKEAVTTSS